MTRYLLDITRTISRVGHGWPTGIDRVELAYVRELTRRDPNALGLARLSAEQVVVPLSQVARVVQNLVTGRVPGRLSMRDVFRLKLPYEQRAARSFLRRLAMARSRSAADALADLKATDYVNVGHTNLDAQHLSALSKAGLTIHVMVHDLIPLTHPEFTRPDTRAGFEARMRAVAAHADRVICNSAATESDVLGWFSRWGRPPPTVAAHLGVPPPSATHAPASAPSFVALGTIEPRKNHAVLFAAWEMLARDGPPPILKVIGKRGWLNEDVFAWLDASPLARAHVIEMADVDDAELAAHLSSARALLFPSRVEGFGLPALEAAAIGLPVICSELPVFRELLGDAATYLPVDDATAWAEAVRTVAQSPFRRQDGDRQATTSPTIPTWDSHFRHVFG